MTCPLPDLTPLPAGDACTASLEANGVAYDPALCAAPAPLPVMNAAGGHVCWAGKLAANGIVYGGPTSTYRTYAYDAHLFNVFDLRRKHNAIHNRRDQFPALAAACATQRAAVEAEQARHGIVYAVPAVLNSIHQQGRAFDVASRAIDAVETTTGADAGVLVRSASPASPACTLIWGGDWDRGRGYDPVHFQLR